MIRKGVKTQMKIVAGLGSIDEYIPYVKAGQTNFSVATSLIHGRKNMGHFCLLTAGKSFVPMYS